MTLTETKLHKAILGRDRSFLAEDIEAAVRVAFANSWRMHGCW